MAYNLKEAAKKPDRLTGGHRMCAGCGAPVVVRNVLKALKPEDHAVIGSATGCLEVSTFIYPIQHGKIPLFIMHLKMPLLQYPVQRQRIKH